MFKVEIVDKQKPIVKLTWSGTIKKEEVGEANKALEKAYNEIGKRKYYFIVDISELNVFLPEAHDAMVEQQKMFLPQMIVVAEVTKKLITKIHINKSKEQAGNNKTVCFDDVKKAEEYLRNL